MKAFRIQNDIVAARDEQEAIVAWGSYDGREVAKAGPVEELDPVTFMTAIENEDGSFREGALAEAMPAAGAPAQMVAEGECEDCS